jgi:DNA-binding LytR/AlgR family response regulator
MDLLDNIQSNPFVIFTTAYSKFAVDSYNYNAIDYLLKPFEFDRFQLAVDKVYEQLNATIKNKTFFFIKDGFKTVKIMFDQILFIKGSGNYLDIITEEGRHSPRMTFESIIAKVPPVNFIRIHQSYLVNLSKIEKIEHNHVFMGKHQIPISHRYKMALFKRLEL